MKYLLVILSLLTSGEAFSNTMEGMQHGFILAEGDQFASHLVATGHHSRQTNVVGTLKIPDNQENSHYRERRRISDPQKISYFLFQAQDLSLPSLQKGQVLVGHIVESRMGMYEPANQIVSKATFTVERVMLNISNPFFVTTKFR